MRLQARGRKYFFEPRNMRLRLGQNASQSLLTETLADAPAIIFAAETVPLADIGWFNPWLDIAAARHETADSRMFIS